METNINTLKLNYNKYICYTTRRINIPNFNIYLKYCFKNV